MLANIEAVNHYFGKNIITSGFVGGLSVRVSNAYFLSAEKMEMKNYFVKK